MNAFGIHQQRPPLVMFMDAASALDWPAKLDAISVILSELPPEWMETFANRLGMAAWEKQRHAPGDPLPSGAGVGAAGSGIPRRTTYSTTTKEQDQ